MKWYRAQDTFVAGLQDGTERVVTKNEALPEDHELVRRDIAARNKGGRTPLFVPLDEGDDAVKPSKGARSGG